MSWRLRIFTALVVIWLVVPVLVVVPLSFTGEQSFVFPPPSWSTRWYTNLFEDDAWRESLFTSLRIAVYVVVCACVVGTAAALSLDRVRFRFKGVLQGLLLAPMIIPIVIVAVGIYSVFLPRSLTGTDLGFVLAHTMLALPFVIVSVSISLAGFDRRLEDAAASLGASPLVTFLRVTLPNILPGVAAGAIFAFITSFDELVVALFLSSPVKRTLPIEMYTTLETIDPTIAAASTVLLAATTAVTLLALIFGNARTQGKPRPEATT
jgi:putative spermidine/putrescine transport system permease protein